MIVSSARKATEESGVCYFLDKLNKSPSRESFTTSKDTMSVVKNFKRPWDGREKTKKDKSVFQIDDKCRLKKVLLQAGNIIRDIAINYTILERVSRLFQPNAVYSNIWK